MYDYFPFCQSACDGLPSLNRWHWYQLYRLRTVAAFCQPLVSRAVRLLWQHATGHMIATASSLQNLNLIVAVAALFKLLSEFAKFRKATISFVISVRPSVRMEILCSHSTDLHEIWHFIFEKVQISLTCDEIKEQFT